MNIGTLLKKKLPEIPNDIRKEIKHSNITSTLFDNKNSILQSCKLQKEVGYKKLEDGSYLVSMYCPMPSITPEMIKWWFWWHPKKDERYKVWFPGEHYSISYPKMQSSYFECDTCPPFQNNTQYPVERIGGMKMPLRIDFVTPEEFGFSKSIMQENNIPLIVCGHVGAFNGIVMHTEMAHIFKQTDDGLYMISRFWLGKLMKNKLLRKMIITDDMAKSMTEHCCIEYRNLVEILPIMYNENNQL